MIAVIGIGSPFDADQLGWQVIDGLQQSGITQSAFGEIVELSKLDRPGSAVIENMQTASAVILIDAIISKKLVHKEIAILNAKDLLQTTEQELVLVSSHGFGLLQAIQLAKKLDLLPEKTNLVGMNIDVDKHNEKIDDGDIQLLVDAVIDLLNMN